MKALTFRLGQFAIGALLLTVLFRYALNLCIGAQTLVGTIACSIAYFCLMYFTGWYFGQKEEREYDIYDIGFRYHFMTYVICVAVGFAAHYAGWHTESIVALAATATFWGIGVLIHFIHFIAERKKTIKGYARDEIFQ